MKISIVTACLNQVKYIEHTICSVLNQSYQNVEYIIIDGGSIDGTVDIISKYSKYLSYWISEPDKGHYDAVNKGFLKSNGEILCWLNSDDIYLPWALKTVSSIFKSLNDVDWITSLNPGFIDEFGFSKGFLFRSGYSREAFYDGLHLRNERYSNIGMIQQESTFWRRSLWERVGGQINTHYELAGDFELWKRFFEVSDIHVVDSPLACYRVHDKARSRISGLYRSEASQVMSKISFQRNTAFYIRTSIRKFFFTAKLIRIPFLRFLFLKYFGYQGRKIVKDNAINENSMWIIKQYKF